MFKIIKRNNVFTRMRLNPEKHMYMKRLQNEYEHKMAVGRFYLPDRYAEKNGGYYKNEVIKNVYSFIKSKNSNFVNEEYSEIYLDTWKLHGIDFEKNKIELINYLGENIINLKSNKRYLIEQKERNSRIEELIANFDFSKKNIDEFINFYSYSLDIFNQIDLGNRSREVLGTPDSTEKNIYLNNSNNKNLKKEFENLENSNFVNKFMSYLHC